MQAKKWRREKIHRGAGEILCEGRGFFERTIFYEAVPLFEEASVLCATRTF
jgi:hypothetical protein